MTDLDRISFLRVSTRVAPLNNLGTFVTDIDGFLHIQEEESAKMVYDLLDAGGPYLSSNLALSIAA